MKLTEQQVRDTIASVERKYPELPQGMLLKLHGIETAGDAGKVNPNAANLTSKAGAVGWFQFTAPTAKAYNVDPTDLVSAADGAARYMRDNLLRYKGNVEHALADYNGGPNAVRALINGKPFAETQGYIDKFFKGGGQATVPVASNAYEKAKALQTQTAQQFLAQPAPVATSIDTTEATTQAAVAVSQQRMEAEGQQVSAWEAIGYGVTQNLTAAIADAAHERDSSFKFGEAQIKQATEAGAANDPRHMTYLEAAGSQEEFSRRLGQVTAWMDTERRMGNETGLAFAGTQAAMMLGAMADPVAVVSTVAAGAGLAAMGVGVASGVAARVATTVGEGFVSNAAVDAAIQSATRTETDWNGVVQQGIVGALFSTGATVAGAAARATKTAIELRGINAEAARVHEDVAADLQAAAVEPGLVTEARVAETVAKAAEAGDAVGKAVATGTDVEVRAPEAEHVPNVFETTAMRGISEAGHGADNANVRAIQRQVQQDTGMEVSVEAAEVTRRARDWEETTGAAGAEVQSRLQRYYGVRDKALAKANAGAVKVIDSMGLTLARSNSKVVRYLSAHLLEIGTGLGKRETSAAIAFDQLNSNLQHRYIPRIKAAMVDAMSLKEKAEFYTGWGVSGQNRIGREVAIYREAKRQAVMSGQDMAKWSHSAAEQVKQIGDALDAMGMDIRDMLRDAGHPDAAMLDGALATGYRPYSWDWRVLQGMLHDSDPMFGQFVKAIQAEFREQVLNPALDAWKANDLDSAIQKHKTNLEANIAALQDKLGELEQTRRSVDRARDDVKVATQAVRDLRAQQRAIREAIKEIELQGIPQQEITPSGLLPDDVPPAEHTVRDLQWLGDATGDEDVTAKRAQFFSRGKKNRVALTSAGDILEMLADDLTMSPGERELAKWIMSEGMRDVPMQITDGTTFRSSYMPLADAINLHMKTGQDFAGKELGEVWNDLPSYEKQIMLHEIAHARTVRVLHGVASGAITDPVLVKAGKRITELREHVKGLPQFARVSPDAGIGYALTNDYEFVAQIFNDAKVRRQLAGIKLEGQPLWKQVVSIIADLLGLPKDKSVLSETMNTLDDLLQVKGNFAQAGDRLFAPRKLTDFEAQQVATLKERLRELNDQAKPLMLKRTEARKRVSEMKGDPVQQVDIIRMQMARFQQELAQFQVPGGEAAYRKKLYDATEKKWLEKANSKAGYYIRQIIQDPKARAEGSMMHLADVAAEILREEHAGGVLTGEGVDSFAARMQEVIQDRTRREINLLRPVGDKLVLDFLSNNDPVGQVMALSNRHSRQAALAKTMGIHSDFDVRGAMEAARADGASPDEIEQLGKAFDIMLGRYDEVEPALVQAAKDFAHAAYMGGQGFSNLSDVSAMVGALGLAGGVKAAGRTLVGLIRKGEDTELMEQLTRVAAGSMGMDHRLNYVLPQSEVTGAVGPADAGRFSRVARRAAQATSYLSLANHVNRAMHRAFTPQLAEHLVKQVQTVTDDARLTDLGLSPDWVQRIRHMLTKHDADRAEGQKINWDSWEDQAAAERMITAIHRGTSQTIQRAMIGERPAWSELNLLGRVAGQFRSFGMTAAEKQLVRSMGLGDTAAATQAAVGLAWAGFLYYARAQAQTVGMSDAERRDFLDKRLSGAQMTAGVLNFWNLSGLASDVGGAVMAMSGATPARGSGIASLDWALSAARAPGKLAHGDTQALKVLPFGNTLPMLGALNLINEED